MTWPALIIWLLILVGLYAPATFALYLFFGVTAFGGLSLLPPGIIGNIPPEILCTALLIFKTFNRRKRIMTLLSYALDLRKLGILTLLSVYVCATSLLYPRLFEDSVRLYALNAASNLSGLAPTSANITQPIYMVISIGMCFVFAYSGQQPEFRLHFLYASLLGAILLLLSGLIDAGFGDIGHEDLLAPFHNATYHLLDTAEVVGQKRVVGFMPEASAFGAACCTNLGFLLFNRRIYESRLQKWIIPFVVIGLIYMTYASTSSGAYVGLAVIGTVAALRFVFEMMFTKRVPPDQLRLLVSVLVAGVAGGIALVFMPRSVMTHMAAILDSVIFQKSSSSSYLERNSWTHAGIAAFWATDGIGVGVGSVRTSNWFVNFAASTGFFGVFLLGSFVLRTILSSKGYPDAKSKTFANGLKLALLPGFVIAALVGTTPNPGSGMMLTLGLIYALRQKPELVAQNFALQTNRGLSPRKTSLNGPETEAQSAR